MVRCPPFHIWLTLSKSYIGEHDVWGVSWVNTGYWSRCKVSVEKEETVQPARHGRYHFHAVKTGAQWAFRGKEMYLGLSFFSDFHALRPYRWGLNCCPHVSTVEEKMGWMLVQENFCWLLFMARLWHLGTLGNKNALKAWSLACFEIDKKWGGDLVYTKQDFLAKVFHFLPYRRSSFLQERSRDRRERERKCGFFLWKKKKDWPAHPIQLPELSGEHKELKPNVGQANVIVCDESFAARFSRYSSWDSLRKAIAWLLRLKNYLSSYVTRFPGIVIGGPLSVAEIGVTESCLVRIVQREATQERSDVIWINASHHLANVTP